METKSSFPERFKYELFDLNFDIDPCRRKWKIRNSIFGKHKIFLKEILLYF